MAAGKFGKNEHMKCKNCLGDRCRLSGEVCNHLVYDGKCEFANSTENETPTFAKMYEVFASVAKCDEITKERTLFCLKRIAETANLPFDGRGELTIDEWELVHTRLTDGTHPFAHEGGYDPATIKYYYSRYRAVAGCNSKEVRIAYKKRGLVPPDCDIIPTVDFSGKKRNDDHLTDAQVKIIKDKMSELAKIVNDKTIKISKYKRIVIYNRYMRMFFGLYFGMRPCDIHRLKWGSIKQDPFGGYYFEYVPTKTARKTHERTAGGPIHHALMSEIKPFIGDPDEYVLIHIPQMGRGNNRKNRYVRNFKTLERWFGKFMREEVKVKGFHSTYMERKECAKFNVEKHGIEYTAKLLGNTPPIVIGNYVHFDKLRFK